MHFLSIHIELGDEAQVLIYWLSRQEAPLGQQVCNVSIVEVVTAKDVVGERAINAETFLSVALGKQA